MAGGLPSPLTQPAPRAARRAPEGVPSREVPSRAVWCRPAMAPLRRGWGLRGPAAGRRRRRGSPHPGSAGHPRSPQGSRRRRHTPLRAPAPLLTVLPAAGPLPSRTRSRGAAAAALLCACLGATHRGGCCCAREAACENTSGRPGTCMAHSAAAAAPQGGRGGPASPRPPSARPGPRRALPAPGAQVAAAPAPSRWRPPQVPLRREGLDIELKKAKFELCSRGLPTATFHRRERFMR